MTTCRRPDTAAPMAAVGTGSEGVANRRVVVIVCDSLGVGAAPDAEEYGDIGADTLGHVAASQGGLRLPVLEEWGIGTLTSVAGVDAVASPGAVVARMQERAAGKDTTTGHWELMGLVLKHPMPTYPQSFPPSVIAAFTQAIGRGVLGNEVASGTEIIERLGPRHIETGEPIVYTSADSVFQVAAHVDVVPTAQLHQWCEQARALLHGEHAVGRVIARPFSGAPGSFVRTNDRHDYTLEPPGPVVLDVLHAAGVEVCGVGKIEDIFSGRGIGRSDHTGDNETSLDATVAFLQAASGPTLVFTNLVDFDMRFGHRRDPAGYAASLERLDLRLPEIMNELRAGDWLMVTADHGCDPTYRGTDHTREYVPMLAWSPSLEEGHRLADREGMSDLGATVAALFGVDWDGPGASFADALGPQSVPSA